MTYRPPLAGASTYTADISSGGSPNCGSLKYCAALFEERAAETIERGFNNGQSLSSQNQVVHGPAAFL